MLLLYVLHEAAWWPRCTHYVPACRRGPCAFTDVSTHVWPLRASRCPMDLVSHSFAGFHLTFSCFICSANTAHPVLGVICRAMVGGQASASSLRAPGCLSHACTKFVYSVSLNFLPYEPRCARGCVRQAPHSRLLYRPGMLRPAAVGLLPR